MEDKSINMAKDIICQLWCKYTDKLFRYYDFDWMSLQAMYSKYIVNKRKL